MSKQYIEHLAEDRRLCILRLLKEYNGTANDSVIHAAVDRIGHRGVPRSDIRQDLRFLINNGCIVDEWYDDIQVATITRRGVEVAEGSVVVEGIKKPSIGV